MKKATVLALLLAALATTGVEGSGHNAKYLPYALASLLNSSDSARFTLASQLWAPDGDLHTGQVGLVAERIGPAGLQGFLSGRYPAGTKVTLEDEHAWPSHLEGPQELPGAPDIEFVNWVYRIDKPTGPVEHEIFAAIARRTNLAGEPGPVDKVHTQQYRFLSVRLLTLPPPN